MPSQWLKNLGHKASHVRLLRPLYDAQLGQRDTHLKFASYPIEVIPADGGHGRWVASGSIEVNEKRVPLDTERWLVGTELQETVFFDALHGFQFLNALKALGGDTGRRTARQITWKWINDFENYHHLTWSPELTAHRLVNWLMVYSYAFEQADDVFLDAFHNAFYRQFRHLEHTLNHASELDLGTRFELLWALVTIGVHCPELEDGNLESWVMLLKGAVEDISFADGGVMTHCPQDALNFVTQLYLTKQSMTQEGHTVPLWLSKQIELALRFLNHITHSDKNLPCFVRATEKGKGEIEKLTRLAGLRVRRSDMMFTESGYSVMRKGRTSVIVAHHGVNHALNALEVSYHNHRMIVGCGTHLYDKQWAESLKSIQALSALSIGDDQPTGDPNLKAHIETVNGACLWSGTHDAYRADHHLSHTRRLYLDPDGDDIRGEDILVRSIATKPLTAVLRFHLHPTVKVSKVNNGGAVLMQLPNGTGWMFEASNAYLSTEGSVYCGKTGMGQRKTQQIILMSDMDSVSHQIKWAIRRI